MLASILIDAYIEAMHVRELPKLAFERLATEPRTVNVRQFARTMYPSLMPRDIDEDYEKGERLVGELDGFGLCLFDTSFSSTALEVHLDLRTAILDRSPSSALGALVAGRSYDGVWAHSLGSKYREDVSFYIERESLTGGEIAKVPSRLAVLGKVAVVAKELLDSGLFETSSFFENDVQPPPL